MIPPPAKCLLTPLLSRRTCAAELCGHGGQTGDPLPNGIPLQVAYWAHGGNPRASHGGWQGVGLELSPKHSALTNQHAPGTEASKDG